MQPQGEPPPAQATAPAAPGSAARGTIVIEGAPGLPAQTISIPLSFGDVRWLRARRSELADQLTDVKDRREGITDELAGTSGANQAGLEQQLAQVDQRILQLESELAQTEQILTSAPSGFLAAAEQGESRGGGDSDAVDAAEWVAIPVFFIAFVLFPLVLTYSRRIWKQTTLTRPAPADTARLERIEQAVEAIAIEVERVSEGQRFVTKLLSDSGRTPLSLPIDR